MKTLEDALAAIEQMKADHEAEKASILKKNKELVEREKAAKAAADEAQEARDEATAEAAAKSGDIETVKASLERKHASELKKLTDQNTKLTENLSVVLIDNEISKAISTAGVVPEMVPLVSAYLKTGAKMENGVAVAATGEPLPAFISTYFESPAARAVVAAPANSGGGAQGSTVKATEWTKAPETAEEFQKFMELSVNNPAQASALGKQWGMPGY